MIDPKLKNKIVLISGANHGIGAAAAEVFATQGAKKNRKNRDSAYYYWSWYVDF